VTALETGANGTSKRRVGERERRNGGNREQNATGGFESDELAQRVDHPHVPLRPVWRFAAVHIRRRRP